MVSTALPVAYHITTRLRDDRVIAPTVVQRRILAGVVLWQTRGTPLLAFSAPDTHMHLLLASCRAVAGKVAHDVEAAAKQRLGLEVGFSRAEYKAVRSQSHLRNAFIYIMKQYQRHGVLSDPCHEASNLPDLLGMRINGQYTVGHVRSLLPRIKRSDLIPYLGVEDPRESPSVSPEHLVDAAAAAVCLPLLDGRSGLEVSARAAAVQLVRGRLPAAETARLLGIGSRSVRRLARQRVDAHLLQAVQQQVVLRTLLAGPSAENGL